MMCPDDGAIDHVGSHVSLHHFRQRFEHRIEHAGFDPSSVAAKDAVPLAIFVGQVPPLRARPRHPHHAFVVKPVILRRSAPPASFRGQQWPDQCPLIVRYANSFAQDCLPKDSLESTSESHVNLCPRNLEADRDPLTEIQPSRIASIACVTCAISAMPSTRRTSPRAS